MSLKTLSQDEILTLKTNIKFLEKFATQRSNQYQTNLKTVETYLNRIQKMMSPSD